MYVECVRGEGSALPEVITFDGPEKSPRRISQSPPCPKHILTLLVLGC